jgi:hypothetical protein
MLADEKEATCCGGQLILLTGTRVEMDLMIDEDRRRDMTVHTIAFPSRQTTLIDLGTGIINGLQLAVDDDDEQKEDETNRRGIQSLTQSRLAAAFLQILRYDQIDTPTQVLFLSRLNLSNMKNTFDYRWLVL